MIEGILATLAEAIFVRFFYGAAKITLPAITGGRWRAIDLADRKIGYSTRTGTHFAKRSPEGVLYFSYSGSVLLGFLCILLFGSLACLLLLVITSLLTAQ
jgi:hypothetical protein